MDVRLLAGLVVPVLLYGAIGYGIYRWWRSRRAGHGDGLLAAGDATRYALASAVLEGTRFRRRVIDLSEDRYRALAPELGLDFPLLLAVCRRFEREDRIFNWIVLGLTVLSLPAVIVALNPEAAYNMFGEFAFGSGVVLCQMAFLAVVVLSILIALRDLRRLQPFQRENWDHAAVRAEFLGDASNEPWPAAGENVICYGKRHPFVGLGWLHGGWQVAVEMDRAASVPGTNGTVLNGGARNGAAPAAVNVSDLLRSVDASVRSLNINNLEFRFPLFVSGTEVGQVGKLLPDRLARPKRQADAETLGHYWFYADPRARSYRWYTVTDWNGELVFSYLLRFMQRGQSLAIETTQLVLGPVDERYRRVDTVRHKGILGWLRWGLWMIVRTPVTVLNSARGVLHQVAQLFGGTLGHWLRRREIARNPAHNYGALTSIRETMAARSSHLVYFQGVDIRQSFTAIDRRVLNALTDTLQAAGIDVTTLIGQAQTIINSSTSIVGNQGPVTMGNVGAGAAVGANAASRGLAGAVAQAAGAVAGRQS